MNRPAQDPHDLHGKLRIVADEFWSRPDHDDKNQNVEADPNWRPGDPMMTTGQVKASQQYARKISQEKQRQEELRRLELHEEIRRHDREWRSKFGRMALGAVALAMSVVGVVKPGIGLIDRVQERPAIQIVQEAIEHREMDEATKNAYGRILEIYQMVDNDGMKRVRERAAEERAKNANDYAAEESLSFVQEAIEDAESLELVQGVLDDFTRGFGVTIDSIDTDVKLDDAKGVAHATVTVFGGLPKSLIKNSTSLKEMRIVKGSKDESEDHPKAEGEYATHTDGVKRVYINVDGDAFGLMHQVMDRVVGMSGGYEHVVAHELVHAMQDRNGIDIDIRPEDKLKNASWTVGDFVSSHIDRPILPSSYAKTHSIEEQAEIMAGLLTNDSNGLKPPSHSRHFASDLGAKHINELVTLEKWHPGVALQLVAARI